MQIPTFSKSSTANCDSLSAFIFQPNGNASGGARGGARGAEALKGRDTMYGRNKDE